MPPRINKRQQREQEELLALGKQPVVVADADSEEETVPIAPAVLGFAAVSATLKQIHMEIMTMDPAFHRRQRP
jgi:hypothetical protein